MVPDSCDAEGVSLAENEADNGIRARFCVAFHQGHEVSHTAIFKAELAQGANDESADCLHLERVAADEEIAGAVFVAVFTSSVRFEAASGFRGTRSGHADKAFAMNANSASLAASEENSVDRQGGVSV